MVFGKASRLQLALIPIQQPRFFEVVIGFLPYYDAVKDLYSEERAAVAQPPCDPLIIHGGVGNPAWVVMYENDGSA